MPYAAQSPLPVGDLWQLLNIVQPKLADIILGMVPFTKRTGEVERSMAEDFAEKLALS